MVPCLVGRAVVAGGEVDVNRVGVDTDAQEVVKPQIFHREQGLPEVVGPSIGVGGNIGEEFVRSGMVFLERRSVAEFDLIQDVFCIGQGITGLDRSLAGVHQRKGGLCPLNGYE